MKKTILVLSLMALTVVACKKAEDTKVVVNQDDTVLVDVDTVVVDSTAVTVDTLK